MPAKSCMQIEEKDTILCSSRLYLIFKYPLVISSLTTYVYINSLYVWFSCILLLFLFLSTANHIHIH